MYIYAPYVGLILAPYFCSNIIGVISSIILLHKTQKMADLGTVIELFTGMQMLFGYSAALNPFYVHHECQFLLMYSLIETVNDAFPVLLFVSKPHFVAIFILCTKVISIYMNKSVMVT